MKSFPSSQTLSILLTAIAVTSPLAGEPAPAFEVQDSQSAVSNKTGVKVIKGTIELPRKGYWYVENTYGDLGSISEAYLYTEEETSEPTEGERMARLMDLREIRGRRSELSRLYWRIRSIARDKEGLSPKSFAELKNENSKRADAADGLHLIPSVRIFAAEKDENGNSTFIGGNELLIIDTTPAIGDGKHWVLNASGNVTRVEIDAAEMENLGLKIVPQASSHLERDTEQKPTALYTIHARVTGPPALTTLTLRDFNTKQARQLSWDTRNAGPGDEEICAEWAERRLEGLDAYVRRDAPLAHTWAMQTAYQYGIEEDYSEWRSDLFPDNDRRTPTVMGVLGGRAAIRETLQMQALAAEPENADSWNPTIPIDDIPGVEIEAHPFDKMLADNPGGSLPLADWIPHDHFMLYLQKPDGIFSLLDGGAGFLSGSGSMMTGRSMSYDLKGRYLESFGISENLMRRFLDTGAIEEMAVSIPDLFLIDGTEMSVVMRTGRPLLTTAALALIGIPPGDGDTVQTNDRGEKVYWARRGDILIVSTNQQELQAILKAKETNKGLGKSAELRFMLTKVPVTPDTVVYAYFSDPFIRKLVGPETKIGQFRRMHARRELENASAASLLAKFDGHGDKSFDATFLTKHGYSNQAFYVGDLALDNTSLASSGFYGTAANLNSLTDLQVDKASEIEKKAYEQYLQRYNNFWRQFYDPIAIRYEKKPDGQHQLETFILPLIDNTIYGGLRQILTAGEDSAPMRVPIIEPTPIATLSLNLNEDTLIEAYDDFWEFFEDTLGLDGSLLELIGPDVHLALRDADPIIALGSGEFSSLFGGMGRGNDMMGISVAISMLTRPCTLHIGLQDPDLVRKKLAEMSWAPSPALGLNSPGFGEGSLYRIAGQDKWVYRYSIEGIITLRYGIEIQDRYLVVNNLPFSNELKITGHKIVPGGAAHLSLSPSSCIVQHPALFASAMERLRFNSTSGVACLSPLMVSGEESIASAQETHARLFGFTPVHPADGTWTWDPKDSNMTSSHFGAIWAQEQPPFDPTDQSTGILSKVADLTLGMKFEDDGLRSSVQWTTKE